MSIKINSLSLGIAIICISILASSCNSGNSIVSSFSKRKYTKGYFINTPSNVYNIAGNTEKPVIEKVAAKVLPQKVITINKNIINQHSLSTAPITNSRKELKPTNTRLKDLEEFSSTLKIMRPDTSHVAQDTVDEFYKERKTNRILGVIGMTAAVAGIVFIITTNFILAPIFIAIGLIISAIGIKRGSNSLLALFGFIISAIGVILLLDILITSH